MLSGLYQSSTIWRPQDEMIRLMWVMHVANFFQTVGFVYIYYKLIDKKSPFRGIWYGLTFGFISGMGMGFATYAMVPMPYMLALSWFFGAIVIYGIAGWVTGMMIKE